MRRPRQDRRPTIRPFRDLFGLAVALSMSVLTWYAWVRAAYDWWTLWVPLLWTAALLLYIKEIRRARRPPPWPAELGPGDWIWLVDQETRRLWIITTDVPPQHDSDVASLDDWQRAVDRLIHEPQHLCPRCRRPHHVAHDCPDENGASC